MADLTSAEFCDDQSQLRVFAAQEEEMSTLISTANVKTDELERLFSSFMSVIFHFSHVWILEFYLDWREHDGDVQTKLSWTSKKSLLWDVFRVLLCAVGDFENWTIFILVHLVQHL